MVHKKESTSVVVVRRGLELCTHICGYNDRADQWRLSVFGPVGALKGIEYGGVSLVRNTESLTGLPGPDAAGLPMM